MARDGGTATPINPGIVARVAGAVRGAIRGASDGWFGPGQALAPVAPPEVAGRQFDYPFAANLSGRPRSEQGDNGIDFATLRAFADPTQGGLDLLRVAIERRKDQMASQRWVIRARDGTDGGKRARDIEQDWRFPDGEHTFAQWQRLLLEDQLVIDAATVYLAPGTKGHRIPQVMDGATLKRLVRLDGRTPLPPDPAFQQHLKGLPAVDYSLDDVVYMPRNLRSHRLYGMGPVEQVLMTLNIALRRQMSQLEYYTAGTVPDVLLGAPEAWTPDQIRQIQTWLDSELSGNTDARRRMRLVPGGIKPFPFKEGQLKDEFDEWLARIICFSFSLSPQALTKQMNRATADTAKESAQEEGLEPQKLWFKDTADAVLAKGYDAGDLELWWQDEEIADPVSKATVTSLAVGKKAWITQDEARQQYGLKPMTAAQREELNPPPPPQLEPGAGEDVPEVGPQKLGKSRRSLRRWYSARP